MADFVDIPLGYNIPTQIPLDVKTYVEDEDTLKDLGFGNQKAFKYYKGLIMFCINENTRYEWTEVTPQNDGSGLLLSNYIYPTNHSAFGINYSNKAYNFFNVQFGTVVDGSETKVIQGSNITITGNGTESTPYVISGPAAASTTYLSSGTNTSVTGDGQLSTPYRVNVTFPPVQDGSETKIQAGTNASISGNGTTTTPYIISTPVPTGSETKIQAGSNVTVSGRGTIGSPYIVNSIDITSTYSAGSGLILSGNVFSVDNLQREITTNTTLSDTDNNYVIFINNGATPITITINTTITKSNFNCGFIQEGTGDVTFVGSGVSLSNPIGLKSKGQGYATFIERKLATSTFYLLGDTKI